MRHALKLEVFWGERCLSVDVVRSPNDLTAWGIARTTRTAWGYLLDGRRLAHGDRVRFRTAEGLAGVARTIALPERAPGVPLLGAWWRGCAAAGLALLVAAGVLQQVAASEAPYQRPLRLVPGRLMTLPPVRLTWGPAQWERPRPTPTIVHLRPRLSTDHETVEKVVRQNTPELHECYDQALRRLGTFSGTVQLRWTVDRSGRVSRVDTPGARLGDRRFTACLTKSVQGWQFPAPRAKAATFTYPLKMEAYGY